MSIRKRSINSNSNSPSLTVLPTELLEKTLLMLPIGDVERLCKVNKEVQEICNTESFWRQMTKRDFNVDRMEGEIESGAATRSWKCLYQFLSSSVYTCVVKSNGEYIYMTFLTRTDAIDWIIKEIETDSNLFHLREIQYEELQNSNQVSNDMKVQLFTKQLNDLFISLEHDDDKKRQFLLARELAINEIREDLIDAFDKFHFNRLRLKTNYNPASEYIIYDSPVSGSSSLKRPYDGHEFIQVTVNGNMLPIAHLFYGSFEDLREDIQSSMYITNQDQTVTITSYDNTTRSYVHTRYTPMDKDVQRRFIDFVEQIAPHKVLYK